MRGDAIQLEEERLEGIDSIDDYLCLHERHRIFPEVFENRNHRRILDIAAGVGVVGKRIRDYYKIPDGQIDLLCNDICPTCLRILEQNDLQTVTFSIDDKDQDFPFPDGSLDAVVALATIEHVINIDHFVAEIYRILDDTGYLYVSAPNYAGLTYLLPFLWSGRTFHNPLVVPSRYEFYAHVRYFTYQTLWEFVSSFGFILDSVYIGIPEASSRYQQLYAKSKFKALAFRTLMKLVSICGSPRWASEPVLCFSKFGSQSKTVKPRKILL